MTIRVGVFGVGGRMGTTVAHAVTNADDLALVGAVDPSYSGVSLGEVAGLADSTLPIAAGPDELLDADGHPIVDVMVDFTHVDAARANLDFCASHGIHAVVGTSGFTEADHRSIATSFDRSKCLLAPNFAIGAVLMIRFAELAAPYFDTGEIIELHHDGKIDAPSGTAIGTAERMANASADWSPDPTETETIERARGAKGPGGIPIHSVRMRGMTAHQEVILGAAGQTLTLRHDSYDRSSFMPGVLMAVRAVGDARESLTVGLDRLLGI